MNIIGRPNGRTAEGMWVKGLQQGIFKLRVPKDGVFTCQFEKGLPSRNVKVKHYSSQPKGFSTVIISKGLP